MTVEINIKDGALDLDSIVSQIPLETLMDAIRRQDGFDKAYAVSEMRDMSEHHYRTLTCKVLEISEMSDDGTIMRNFRERCNIKAETLKLKLN